MYGISGGAEEEGQGFGRGTSVFGSSGIDGSRMGSSQDVHYGLTSVEIIPYGEVELK